MQAPSGGSVAPQQSASAQTTTGGAALVTATTVPATAAGKASASGTSTRCMPARSTRRPSSGPAKATPTE